MENMAVGSTITVNLNGRQTEMVVQHAIVYSPENYPNCYKEGMAGLVGLRRPGGKRMYVMTVWQDGTTSKVRASF